MTNKDQTKLKIPIIKNAQTKLFKSM